MKKIIALVITLSLVITMFASVTAFAATATELPWPGVTATATLGTTSELGFSPTNNKGLPSGTEYVVETAYFTFAANTKLNNVQICGYYSIYPNQTLSAEDNHTVDIVYVVDEDTFYLFVDKMFKGSYYGDGISNNKRTANFKHNYLFSAAPASMTVEKKAYDSDFKFKEMGFYGGTATYDKASRTYSLTRNIARMRTFKNNSASIGCYSYDTGSPEETNGMYIAGYYAGKLLFVEKTNYYVEGASSNNTGPYGTAPNIDSAVTEEADSIKLFIYDAVHHESANIVPAIEALEYQIIQ